MSRLGCKPFFVAAALWMAGCGDETTVNEMAGVPELASGAALPACTEDNAGELLYAADSGLTYLCQNAEWIPLGNAEYGADTLVIRDTLFFSSVDTLILRDTLVDLNGTSCTAEALADGSGYKVLCGGDSVGVVKNGRDGNAAVDTLFLSTRDTLVVSNVDTLVLKDTLIVKDTLVLSNRDTLVIIDTVFCIQKPQASSSSAAQSSSSSAVNISTSEFVTWVGANSDYRVETGFDDGTDTYGYWYNYSGGGSSTIAWPVATGASGEMDPVIDHCGGVCGVATMGSGNYLSAGVAFHLGGSLLTGNDISGWNGICIEYKSTGIRPALVIITSDEISTGNNDYKASLPIAASETVVNLAWSDFTQDAGWGTQVDRSEVLSKAATLKFDLAGSTGQTSNFNIAKIGRYGQCGTGSQASSSSAAQSSSSSAVNISTSEFVTWVGANSEYRVETGFDDGTDTYGYWYELSDNTETDDGGPGASSITWPVRKGNAYSDDAMDPIIEHCDGLCGRATLAGPYTYPYVGLAFNISGSDKYGVDISGWDGICVEYKSTEIRPSLVIVPENNSSVTGGNDYKVLMPIAASETVVNFAWSNFKQEAGWGTIVDRSAVLSKAATVWVKFAGVDGRTTNFNIAKIGRYGQCGTGSQASSSSAAQPSSSSAVNVSTSEFVTWVGANSEYRVETGFNDGTDTYGYWYEELVDGGTIAWPVTKGNDYSDDAMDPIIDYCGGICGVAAGTGSNPSVYFGFNISGSDRRGVDISGWNGICVKYKSTGIGPRLLIVPSSEISTGYDDYAASLPIAASETVVNLAWSNFTQGGWGTAVNRSAVLAKAAAIKFHFNTSLGQSADFNIAKIGRYGQCGD